MRGGLRLYLHPRDWIEYLLLRGDDYEPRTLDFLSANLRPGDGAIVKFVSLALDQHLRRGSDDRL